eukprot:364753-Chlamydomonas_euryale.AAC.7
MNIFNGHTQCFCAATLCSTIPRATVLCSTVLYSTNLYRFCAAVLCSGSVKRLCRLPGQWNTLRKALTRDIAKQHPPYAARPDKLCEDPDIRRHHHRSKQTWSVSKGAKHGYVITGSCSLTSRSPPEVRPSRRGQHHPRAPRWPPAAALPVGDHQEKLLSQCTCERIGVCTCVPGHNILRRRGAALQLGLLSLGGNLPPPAGADLPEEEIGCPRHEFFIPKQ